MEETADEDKIRFDTKGIQRMIIDDEGKVGIGVSFDPNATLSVVSPAGVQPFHITSALGGATLMTIEDGGNVGIGVANPDAKLHVNSQIRIEDGTQGLGKVLTSDAQGNSSWATPPAQVIMDEINDDDDDTSVKTTFTDQIEMTAGGNLMMRISDNGRIGLGNFDPGISPLTDLHMYDPSTTDIVYRMQSSQSSGTAARLELGGTDGSNNFDEYGNVEGSNNYLRLNAIGTSDIEFRAGGGEIMRITDDGKVSVNDDNPDAFVEISGDIGIEDYLMISSDDHLDGDVLIVDDAGDVGIGISKTLMLD